MKKFLLASLLALSSYAYAAEQIKVLWAFDIGSNQAITLRKILEVANSQQSKYEFIIENKKGAGGTIAANEVNANPATTIVGMSSSFIIRPAIEKENSHKLTDFLPVLVQANGTPIALAVRKTLDIQSSQEITMGISGFGTVSHLFAENFSRDTGKKVKVVPFKSLTEAYTAVLGGFVDSVPMFVGDLKDNLPEDKVYIFGYTGINILPELKTKSYKEMKYTSLQNLTVNYAIYSSTKMDKARRSELFGILNKANQHVSVFEYYQKDNLITAKNENENDQVSWYQEQIKYWSNLALLISINNIR